MQDTDEARAERVAEEVFLSPRVVDAATFREFAEALRQLLVQAAEQREMLQRSVTDGEAVTQTLRDTTGQATEKLRPALKLIPTIDQKLEQAREALNAASGAAERASEGALESTHAAVDAGLKSLSDGEAAIREAMERARALESRLGQLTQRAEMAVELLDNECKSRLEEAAKHAQDVLGTLVAEVEARGEAAIARQRHLLVEQEEATEAALEGPITLPSQTTGEAGSQRPPDEVSRVADQASAELQELLKTVRSRMDEEAERVSDVAASTHREAAEAEERLSKVREELAQVDQRGREISAVASQALEAFDQEISRRMHAVREVMEQLATVSTQTERSPTATEVKPAATEPSTNTAQPTSTETPTNRTRQFHRIDRPADPNGGLPGPLRF